MYTDTRFEAGSPAAFAVPCCNGHSTPFIAQISRSSFISAIIFGTFNSTPEKSPLLLHAAAMSSAEPSHQSGGGSGGAGGAGGCRWTIVRHAESAANAHTRSWPVLLTCRCCVDPGLVDPSLSEGGAASARALGEQLRRSDYIAAQHVDVVIVRCGRARLPHISFTCHHAL